MLRSTRETWGGLVRLLHWGMAVLYAVIIAVGYYMSDLPNGVGKMKIYAFHKSLGVMLLGLALARLLWRTIDARPATDPMPAWQQRAALLTLVGLYALMLALPLTGWLYNSAAGFPLRWFNLVNLPALTAADPQIKGWAKELHETLAVLLIALASLHVLGALKHHFLDKDSTLRRMLGRPGGSGK